MKTRAAEETESEVGEMDPHVPAPRLLSVPLFILPQGLTPHPQHLLERLWDGLCSLSPI